MLEDVVIENGCNHMLVHCNYCHETTSVAFADFDAECMAGCGPFTFEQVYYQSTPDKWCDCVSENYEVLMQNLKEYIKRFAPDMEFVQFFTDHLYVRMEIDKFVTSKRHELEHLLGIDKFQNYTAEWHFPTELDSQGKCQPIHVDIDGFNSHGAHAPMHFNLELIKRPFHPSTPPEIVEI